MRTPDLPPILLLAAATACATVPPDSAARLDAPFAIPARFGEPAAAGAPAAALDLAALDLDPWWEAFASAELSASVRAALAGNADLGAAAHRVAAARAQARAVAGARLPQLDAGLDLSRSRRNVIGLPIPGAPEVLPITASQQSLGLDFSWEVDLWQRLAAAERAALAEAAAAAEDRRALALALAGQTARTWLTLAHQDEYLALLAERLALAEDALALARSRLAAGTGDAAGIPRAEAAIAGLRARVESETATRDSTAAELQRLQGGIGPAPAAPALTLPPAPAAPPEGLPATVLARRPDLRAAASRVLSARARSHEADAALLPRLQLTASGGTVSEALGDLLDGDFRVWSLAGGVFTPLFAGGRLRAQAEGAAALADAAAADYAARALLAFAECEGALAADARLRAAHDRGKEAADAREREWRAARRRHGEGTGDAAETLALADAALAARADALALRYAALLQRVDLHLALGGGATSVPTP